jgi:REP element-mobilizing transposase RayT
MARRPRLFAPGVLYHVIVRGNQRQRIFTSDGNYRAYIERLARYRKKYDYVLHGYCLMPNHVHLLVESSEHPLAKLMQGLQQSYSQYLAKPIQQEKLATIRECVNRQRPFGRKDWQAEMGSDFRAWKHIAPARSAAKREEK